VEDRFTAIAAPCVECVLGAISLRQDTGYVARVRQMKGMAPVTRP
jgi:hypothetical protein